jgi:RNA polymerase sigma-70 factor (ECF subfamily)
LRKVAQRDRVAFAALYRATSAKLTGVVSRIVQRGDASEIVQEAFVRVWERAGDYDEAKGSAIAWMATIARNRALDEVRRARPASLEDMPEGFEPADVFVDPLAGRERSEEYLKLMNCLQRLEPERREMILLAYYRGATREALSQRYGAPVATIKTWLRRGLGQLRECLGS